MGGGKAAAGRPKSVSINAQPQVMVDAFPAPSSAEAAATVATISEEGEAASDSTQNAEGNKSADGDDASKEKTDTAAAEEEDEPEKEDPTLAFYNKMLDMGAPMDQEATLGAYEEAYPSTDSMRQLDFGDDCVINSQRTLKMVLRNHTAIPTSFALAAVTMNAGNEARWSDARQS